ncbi:MAG TPA: hypothetical protein VK203_26605 [Nostocaceae cyanobacterium]|nr:hypothetical protein [Nostocaceae cyanobacterium]
MLKNSFILSIASASLASVVISPAMAAPADFVGTWVNTNPNTGGITRVVITSAGGNKLNIEAFGKCQPSDCKWGKTNLVTYGNSVQDANHRYGTATYNPGFAETLLTLDLRNKNALTVQNFTRFTDNSGRQNYSLIENFKR